MKYEIGRRYRVPTVMKGTEFWPVLLPGHDDLDIIGFPFWHYHVDPRFLSDRRLQNYAPLTTHILAFPISVMCLGMERAVGGYVCPVGLPKGDHPHELMAPQQVIYRRLKCRREMPRWPRNRPMAWLKRMEDAYEGYRLKPDNPGIGVGINFNNPVCPHRGISLAGLPQSADGTVECPGHALCWNLRTGLLVRQTKDKP